MNFLDDPRRQQIEPMHEFLTTWAQWGRFKPFRYTSLTYRVMCWMRDHSKTVQTIREGIVTGERVHYRVDDETAEKVALKVEHYLRKLRDIDIGACERLRFYYLKASPEMPIGKIAKKLGCAPWKVDETIKNDLYQLSKIWED